MIAREPRLLYLLTNGGDDHSTMIVVELKGESDNEANRNILYKWLPR